MGNGSCNESKEVYTFGQQPAENQEPKMYMMPSPKIKHKKFRMQHRPGNSSKKEKARVGASGRGSAQVKAKPGAEGRILNVFSESLRSNQISRGKNSPKGVLEGAHGSSPKGLHLMSFGQTFGDQPMLGWSQESRERPNREHRHDTNQKGKRNGNSQENNKRNVPIQKGFQSQRQIKKAPETLLQQMRWGANTVRTDREPNINMKKVAKPMLRHSESRNRSHSNSSGSGANMAPAWSDSNLQKDPLGPDFMKKPNYAYQFKSTISPKKSPLNTLVKSEKFQTMYPPKNGGQLGLKEGFPKRGQRRAANKYLKAPGLSLKKPKAFRKSPLNLPSTGKKPNVHLKRLQSANKVFKVGRKAQLAGGAKPGKMSFNMFKKGTRGSNLGERAGKLIKSQQNFMPGKLKVGRKERMAQKMRKAAKPVNKVKSIKTERLMTRKKSREAHSQRFNSNFDNTQTRKSGNKFVMTRRTPATRPLKRIPYKSPRQAPSSMKNVKMNQKRLFAKPPPGKKFSSSITVKKSKVGRYVNPSPVPPSIGSVGSMKNMSPISKRTGYFMKGLNARNKSQRTGTPGVGKLGGLRGKKTQKKISARREYFDTQTNSFKKSSVAGLNSNKSLSFRKKFMKNRSQSNAQKTKKGTLTKNYSKKKLSRPQHQRKQPAAKNLSTGHKFLGKKLSRSRDPHTPYGKFKVVSRGNSLTSPLKGSLKGARRDWKLPRPGPMSQANSERKNEAWQPRDKSKVSSRAAATSRYTSSDKNSGKASLLKNGDKGPKRVPARRNFPRKPLRDSYFKAQGKKKSQVTYDRKNFRSITDVKRMALMQQKN